MQLLLASKQFDPVTTLKRSRQRSFAIMPVNEINNGHDPDIAQIFRKNSPSPRSINPSDTLSGER